MLQWLAPQCQGEVDQCEKENVSQQQEQQQQPSKGMVVEDVSTVVVEDITDDDDDEVAEEPRAPDQMRTQTQMESFLVSELRALREGPVTHRFQVSARSYASPLFNTFKKTQLSTRLFAARKCATKFSADALVLDRVRHSLNEEKQQAPVTVIKFDRLGALFAVGGVNGIVRVYDFDECLLRMSAMAADGDYGKGKCVRPVVAVDTRTRVSDLAWSLCNDDEISVCFSFRSDIHVYDLQDLSRPRQILQVGKNVSGGHNVIRYLKFLGRSRSEGGEQHVVAAGKSGHIRKWSITSSPHRVKWEVCADPNATQAQGSPVVGLTDIEGKRLIAITQSGVVTVWDLENMTVPSFGVASLPSLLLKVSLTGGLFSVAGMSFTPTHVSEILRRSQNDDDATTKNAALSSSAGATTLVQGQLLVTMACGNLRLFDLLDNGSTVVAKHALWTAKPPSMALGSLTEMAGCLLHAGNSATSCPAAVLPAFFGGQICCSASGESLGFYELGKAVVVRAASSSTGSSSSSVYGRLHQGTKAAATPPAPLQKVYSYVNFLPTFKPCYTLAGHVLSVEHGGREVIVTQIVDRHLCAAELSAAYPSRSHEVYLDWSRGNHLGPVGGAVYSIAGIQPFVIILSQPYTGPTVEGGMPRVHLRTNLSPCTDDGEDERSSKQTVCEHITRRECFISQTDLPTNADPLQPRDVKPDVTAIAFHGRLPYILVGRSDDSVILTVSHEPRDDSDEESSF